MSGTTAPPPEIVLTRLTKAGGPLTKQISLAADGTLIKDKSACVMFRGTAERVTVDGVDGLGALIETLTESQALALGGKSACVMSRGTAERVTVAGVAALGALIEDADSRHRHSRSAACAPICLIRLRSRPRRCCSTAQRGRT